MQIEDTNDIKTTIKHYEEQIMLFLECVKKKFKTKQLKKTNKTIEVNFFPSISMYSCVNKFDNLYKQSTLSISQTSMYVSSYLLHH